jgi:hypothetical protein
VYESLTDLHRGLLAVELDPDTAIVRVKNRYSRHYSGDDTAGYRCAAAAAAAAVSPRLKGVERFGGAGVVPLTLAKTSRSSTIPKAIRSSRMLTS